MSDAVVIVGSGLAGYNVARELRKLDAAVPIVVISRDQAGFYSKPMLSNALAGKKTAATLVMKPADKMAAELNARVVSSTAVDRVDADRRELTLAGGEVIAWRDLVLATGADPIRLPLQGDAADTVLSVNDLDDFARFAEALDTAAQGGAVQRVAILGAGLIGCEFANDLLARGIEPTVLDLADRALARLLPPQASARLQD
ncbi:MAG TPA: FAD-dependent oxidoreductase, partial [Aquabacterium sp.]|nr:FAD-dependent oxidoreductase [Aquabacterium sp.]